MLRTFLLASVAFALTACATPDAETAAARDCFRAESVSSFRVIDRNTVEVNVGVNRRYHLSTNWPTVNLDFSERIALRSATGSICTGSGVGVEIVGGEPITAYPIQSIARAPDAAAQG